MWLLCYDRVTPWSCYLPFTLCLSMSWHFFTTHNNFSPSLHLFFFLLSLFRYIFLCYGRLHDTCWWFHVFYHHLFIRSHSQHAHPFPKYDNGTKSILDCTTPDQSQCALVSLPSPWFQSHTNHTQCCEWNFSCGKPSVFSRHTRGPVDAWRYCIYRRQRANFYRVFGYWWSVGSQCWSPF